MNYSKVAVRYAKALYVTSQEKNLVDDVKNDMVQIEGVLKSVPEFTESISNPIAKSDIKKTIIKGVFEGKVNTITFNFLNLIIDNKREEHLDAIVRDYLDLYRKEKGIKKSVITSVKGLDDKTRESIIKFIKNNFNTEVEIEEQVNPELIGGIILRVGDHQYDMSVAGKLKVIEREFKNSTK
jgi:F-type H+-transporting ATPase subunit delta